MIPGNVLLSHAVSSAVQSGLRGLTSVFGMGTGVTPSLESPENLIPEKRRARKPEIVPELLGATAPSKSYGQAERAISSGKLQPLLAFHIRPIKQVVYLRPS